MSPALMCGTLAEVKNAACGFIASATVALSSRETALLGPALPAAAAEEAAAATGYTQSVTGLGRATPDCSAATSRRASHGVMVNTRTALAAQAEPRAESVAAAASKSALRCSGAAAVV
jgi:hypothetical protein